MRASRFLLFIGCFSCAEISGLSELGVDAAADAGDAGPTFDAMPDANLPRTFCQSTTTTYTFCADFDEGDVTKGYVNPTTMAPWSNVSTQAPTLSTVAFVSGPAAAQFNGDLSEALGLIQTASAKMPTAASAAFSLRIDTLSNISAVIVPIPIDDNQTVSLIAVPTQGEVYRLALSDASTATDGGNSTYASTLDIKPGEWHSIAISLTTAQITLTIDGGPPTIDPRVTSGPLSALQFHLGVNGKGWQGSVDNVTIFINN
jgi:hypothetical protein